MARQFGDKLNPYRRLRKAFGVKAIRQSVVIVNDPSRIDQNQPLLVRFQRLGSDVVIVPGTIRLAFNISLTSRDPNRTVVQNLGRAIVKKNHHQGRRQGDPIDRWLRHLLLLHGRPLEDKGRACGPCLLGH